MRHAAPSSHLGFQLNHVHALFTSHKRTGSLAYDGASTMLMTMTTTATTTAHLSIIPSPFDDT